MIFCHSSPLPTRISHFVLTFFVMWNKHNKFVEEEKIVFNAFMIHITNNNLRQQLSFTNNPFNLLYSFSHNLNKQRQLWKSCLLKWYQQFPTTENDTCLSCKLYYKSTLLEMNSRVWWNLDVPSIYLWRHLHCPVVTFYQLHQMLYFHSWSPLFAMIFLTFIVYDFDGVEICLVLIFDCQPNLTRLHHAFGQLVNHGFSFHA